jgi:hypothetical protein
MKIIHLVARTTTGVPVQRCERVGPPFPPETPSGLHPPRLHTPEPSSYLLSRIHGLARRLLLSTNLAPSNTASRTVRPDKVLALAFHSPSGSGSASARSLVSRTVCRSLPFPSLLPSSFAWLEMSNLIPYIIIHAYYTHFGSPTPARGANDENSPCRARDTASGAPVQRCERVGSLFPFETSPRAPFARNSIELCSVRYVCVPARQSLSPDGNHSTRLPDIHP